MAKKKKGELPSGNIRRQIYNGMKQKVDKSGNPVFDDDGKPVMVRDYISITAASVKDAEKEKAAAMIDRKGKPKPQELTLYDAIENYINTSQSVLSPTTVSGYRAIQKYGFRSIINTNIHSLSANDIRHAVNIEAARLTNRGTTISPKTVANEYGLISAVLKINHVDICSAVKLPQKVKCFHELSEPDVIFRIVKGTEIELPVLLSMWLSFTISEIKGLTKSKSISADGNYITIKEVVVVVNSQQVRKSQAKKESRNRKHRIPEYIKELIAKVETDELVTLSGAAIYSRFTKLLKQNNLPHMTFHDLRHVNASVMAMLHIPDKYAQERGGWTSDHVMKETYTQTFSLERIAVDDTIDEYFSGKLLGNGFDIKKYREFVSLFGLADTADSRYVFNEFMDIMKTHTVHDIITATRNATRF